MRSLVLLIASVLLLASSAMAVIHGSTAAFCICDVDKKVLCTNYCGIGKTCTAKCQGAERKVTINKSTGRAVWASSNKGTSNRWVICQDEHECSNYPEGVKHPQMCPKSTKWFKTKFCQNEKTGKKARPGQPGII